MVFRAEHEGGPHVECDDGKRSEKQTEPVGTETHACDRYPRRRLSDRRIAGVEIEIDPAPEPREIVAHIEGDYRLIGLQQTLLHQGIRLDRASRHDVLSLHQVGIAVTIVDPGEVPCALHEG